MVKVYTQEACIQCKYTKKRLDDMNVQYEEIPVNDRLIEIFKGHLGIKNLPVVVWGGMKPDAIKALGED